MLICTVFHRYKDFFSPRFLAFFFNFIFKIKFICVALAALGLTPFVEQTGLEFHRGVPASASWATGLKVCSTMAGLL